jgi:hypothetical protein
MKNVSIATRKLHVTIVTMKLLNLSIYVRSIIENGILNEDGGEALTNEFRNR